MISLLTVALSAHTYAATQQMVWGDIRQALPEFKQVTPLVKKGFINTLQNQQKKDYELKLLKQSNEKNKHSRYQIMYKGLPVWGQQLIFHEKTGIKTSVTGFNITGIENDLPSIQPKLSEEQAQQSILKTINDPIKFKSSELVIFLDDNKTAHLAYHLSLYTNNKSTPISSPNYLIDANNGAILKQWNNARHKNIGQGLGGNAFPLPYRAGMFQHGDALPGLPSLGKFDVQVKKGKCTVKNDSVMVISLQNKNLGYEAFPVTEFDEQILDLKAFSYPCSKASFYLNYADGIDGPVNYSFSPVNDTMYFAQETVNMYKEVYGVEKPLGDDLPIRAYTHLGGMDNAFAIPTIKKDGVILAHQQIVIGNGDMFLTAPAQSVLAHELSHNFTDVNSGLLYDGQTGGINEAFSDMAAIALLDYLRADYPWYWDGEDWALGREAVLGGQPIRYMDEPTKDGYSISHTNDYNDDLDVHLSSGIFNKAFYLLAHKPGWSVQQAFQVMVNANQNYWSPIAYFDFAACGVIQATLDLDLDKTPVIEAFDEVGVKCPMHKSMRGRG